MVRRLLFQCEAPEPNRRFALTEYEMDANGDLHVRAWTYNPRAIAMRGNVFMLHEKRGVLSERQYRRTPRIRIRNHR